MAINLWDYEAGAPYGGDYKADLDALQERVSRLFVANLVHRRKVVVVVEGWDASGKGGAIQRLTARCDPRAEEADPPYSCTVGTATRDPIEHQLVLNWPCD